MISSIPLVMAVSLSVPAKTVPEFIAYAKANPGKINMASGGLGSTSHVGGELFKLSTGVDMLIVPYRGGAPALTDLIGGQVQVYFSYLPESIESRQDRQGARACGDHRCRARRRCRTCRPWAISCRASRQVPGRASARRGTRRLTSSPGSTSEVNAALADPTIKARLAELGSTPRRCRRPISRNSSSRKPRSGPRSSARPRSRCSEHSFRQALARLLGTLRHPQPPYRRRTYPHRPHMVR